jgi:hypothetical protein
MMLVYLKMICDDELVGVIKDDEMEFDLRELHEPWRMLATVKGYVPVPHPAKILTIDRDKVAFEGLADDGLAEIYFERHDCPDGLALPPKGLVVPG